MNPSLPEKKVVLVTGATGNVGKEVLMQLAKMTDRYEIRAFDLKTKRSLAFFDKLKDRIKRRILPKYGDITKVQTLEEATRGVDVTLHFASLIPPAAYRNPALTEAINVGGTRNLIDALERNAPNSFLLFSSSVAVYGDRITNPEIRVGDPLRPSVGDNYAETKVQMEQLIRESNLDSTIFRLSAIMGAGNHHVSGIMFLMPLATPMEFTTPRDTARAFVNALEHLDELKGKTFNLGGGEQCRVDYDEFLQSNFEIAGLGKLDFPEGAFAEHNYHCGIFVDGDELEQIVHFRRDTLQSLYEMTRKAMPCWKRFGAWLLAPIIKRALLKQSDPYKAYRKGTDSERARYFFPDTVARLKASETAQKHS